MKLEKYLPLLLKNPLFEGMQNETDILALLSCTNAHINSYGKNNTIIEEEAGVYDIGILLSGKARASKLDISGKYFILAEVSEGGIFGDVLAVSGDRKSPVAVTAVEECLVLFIPFSKIIYRCGKVCEKHERLLRNILKIVSAKYFELQDRLNCVIKPTLREKILYYLTAAAKRSQGSMIEIPLNREALANYLNAERSALSRELAAMKRDGLIDYHRNYFRLYR